MDILANLHFLFPLSFLVIALITGKDLAYYCFAGSSLSLLVFYNSSWGYDTKIIANAVISACLAIFSFARMVDKRDSKPLAGWVGLICTLSIGNNLLQYHAWTEFSYYASIGIGISMILALIFIDGRREFWNDLADDCRDGCDSDMFSDSSNSHKGSV